MGVCALKSAIVSESNTQHTHFSLKPTEAQPMTQLTCLSSTFCFPSTAEKMFIKWPHSWSVWHGTLSVHWHPPWRGRHVHVALFHPPQEVQTLWLLGLCLVDPRDMEQWGEGSLVQWRLKGGIMWMILRAHALPPFQKKSLIFDLK